MPEHLCIDCRYCRIRDFEKIPMTRNETNVSKEHEEYVSIAGCAADGLFQEEETTLMDFYLDSDNVFFGPYNCEDYKKDLPDHIKLWRTKLDGKHL